MSTYNCEHGNPVTLETDRRVFDQTGVNLDCFACVPTPESQALEHNIIEPAHETFTTAEEWHCLDCDACIDCHGRVGIPNIDETITSREPAPETPLNPDLYPGLGILGLPSPAAVAPTIGQIENFLGTVLSPPTHAFEAFL